MSKTCFFLILTWTTTSLINASEEAHYFVQQNESGSVQNSFFDLFSNKDQYTLNVNQVDLAAPPDLFWSNFGFYFNNTYPQILIAKIDEDTQKISSTCAVYDFFDSPDDFEDIKDHWMNRQLDNESVEEFLQDIALYLRSHSPMSQCNNLPYE